MSLCINPRCSAPKNPDNILFCEACGSELLFQGRYRAFNVLGGGGFGKTYEVKEGTTAVKVLKVLINNSPKAVELFQREAQVLSQLDNPGIPKVEKNGYFVFHPPDEQQFLHCMVMEKVDGDNLWNYIKKRGRPINGDLARSWLIELVGILQQVHERDILHRDIKPQNIILKPNGKLALIDFGAVSEGQGTELATQASGGSSGTEVATNAGAGTSISSKGYTPLEQINGQAAPQSDFFALGRTFVYLLTAKEPFDTTIYDAFNDELNWRQFAGNVPSDLADLIEQMMERLPRQRPINALAILRTLTKDSPASAIPQPSPTVKSIPVTEQIHESISSSPKPSANSGVKLFLVFGVLGVVGGAMAAPALWGIALNSLSHPTPTNTTPVDLPISSSSTTPDSCYLEVTGAIRSQPYKADETKINTTETKLSATGIETQGGWVQGKLSNGDLAWAHETVISNRDQEKSCLTQKGVRITTQDDVAKTPTQTNTQSDDTKKPDQNPSESASTTTPISESAGTIIKCSTSSHAITVTKNENGSYTYRSHDLSDPSNGLLLSGTKKDDGTGETYTFNNGNYSYIVSQPFEGRSGQTYLQVKEPGKLPVGSPCE
jgi:serine/threonine protein kinase